MTESPITKELGQEVSCEERPAASINMDLLSTSSELWGQSLQGGWLKVPVGFSTGGRLVTLETTSIWTDDWWKMP